VLVRRQHWVVSRAQLLDHGLSSRAIAHRLASGRLHRLHAGVYAVGRPALARAGEFMAAVLACGEGAVLSHGSAAELWGIRPRAPRLEVTIPAHRRPRPEGITVHRRSIAASDDTLYRAVPVTNPACTLVDIAKDLSVAQVERAVNEADRLDLIDPEALRDALDGTRGRRGLPKLRRILDRHTFTLTDSELERQFKAIATAAGLPLPQTGEKVNGFKVDFYWPDLGLVVETDGLRYHRTAAQQAVALRRDQAHWRSGLLPLRFSHDQVAHESDDVRDALADAVRRLDR
jgi:very-short-patch-repair endonuclease